MQRPVSGYNQNELEKLAKEQEKAHKKLSESANPKSQEKPVKKKKQPEFDISKVKMSH